MSITPADVDTLAATLSAAPRTTAPGLRAALGGRPVIMLAAEELADETPWRVLAGYEVHLFDGSAHCPQLTHDAGVATGFILAKQS